MRLPLLPPAVLPALALLAGVAVEPLLPRAPGAALLTGLAALVFALREVRIAWLGWLALGLLASVMGARPARETLRAVDGERVVEALVEIAAPAQRWGEAWAAPVQLLRLRQGPTVWSDAGQVWMVLTGPEAPLAGAHLRVRGYLQQSPGQANLEPPRPPSWRLRVKSSRLVVLEGGPGWLGRMQREVRRRAAAVGRGSRGAALARALVLGDAADLPEEWIRSLRRTGLVHLLSLSGVHVALLAGLAFLAASPLGRSRQRALVAVVVLAYLALAGPFPALLRASVMGLLGLASLAARRPPLALNALALAAAGLVALSPELVADLGFQLSCTATAGLVMLTRPLAARFASLPRPLAEGLAATLGAQLASLPWALPAFSTVSPISLLLNLLAIPWTASFLPFSFIWLASASVLPGLARRMAPGLDLLAAPVGWMGALPASPWVVVPFPAGPLESTAISCVAGALILWTPRRRAVLLVAVGALLLRGGGWAPVAPLEVHFLDVGQGDAILLFDGEDGILVDGGGMLGVDLGRRVLVPTLARLGVRRLSAVALSHPDFDHCGGLLDLAGYLPIGELWLPEGLSLAGCSSRLAAALPRPARRLTTGDELRTGRFRLRVISPTAGVETRGDNDRSLALVVEAGGRRIVLAGDLESRGERQALTAAGGLDRCDVLKVAHHGGATSTSSGWLERIRPRLAVISCGRRNRYGHPAASTLGRLRASRALVLRTDRDGIISLRWREGGPLELSLPASPR